MISIHRLDESVVWQRAGEFLNGVLKAHRNDKILLLLSGGSAVKIYGRLVREMRDDNENWKNLAMAQIDDRFQPQNREDINAVAIGKTGLWETCKKIGIPYYLISQESTLEQATDKYNRQLKELFEHFSYKIGVLGIGDDVHTAGLLPGYENSWNKDSYAVGCKNNGRYPERISATPKVLSGFSQAVVVVVGEKKRQAIEKALDQDNLQNLDKYPAVIIQKIKKVDLFTDITL